MELEAQGGAADGPSTAAFDLGPDGHRVCPLLHAGEIAEVRRALAAFALSEDHEFFASPYHAQGAVARRFQVELNDLIDAALARIWPEAHAFLIAATTKGHTAGGTVRFHQDWTYTDERVVRSVFFWCPLDDADAHNGTLNVIPGSHRWTSGLRPSRSVVATEHIQSLFDGRAVPVELEAGTALAFDPALLHGSGPNRSPRPRPAITVGAAPVGTPLVHFHERSSGALVGAQVDDAFFTEHEYGAEPHGYPAVAPWTAAVTTADLVAAATAVRA
jgi:Phytanoyl-CoA dioxygenase (PhyH)